MAYVLSNTNTFRWTRGSNFLLAVFALCRAGSVFCLYSGHLAIWIFRLCVSGVVMKWSLEGRFCVLIHNARHTE